MVDYHLGVQLHERGLLEFASNLTGIMLVGNLRQANDLCPTSRLGATCHSYPTQ